MIVREFNSSFRPMIARPEEPSPLTPCRHQQQLNLKVFKRGTGTDERERFAHVEPFGGEGQPRCSIDRAITASVRDAACISRFFKHAAVASASRFCHRR